MAEVTCVQEKVHELCVLNYHQHETLFVNHVIIFNVCYHWKILQLKTMAVNHVMLPPCEKLPNALLLETSWCVLLLLFAGMFILLPVLALLQVEITKLNSNV